MFIVEFKNSGSPFYLLGGTQGDPPRTLIKSSAKRYKTEAAAKAAITRAARQAPIRKIETWDYEIIFVND